MVEEGALDASCAGCPQWGVTVTRRDLSQLVIVGLRIAEVVPVMVPERSRGGAREAREGSHKYREAGKATRFPK